jgi:protocatechuate 3,4-dioxygenase, alpha subunit
MTQSLSYLRETPSQTAGPYVHIGLAPGAAGFQIYDQELGTDIAGPTAKGERIRVTGRVLDGTGTPVRDVLLETWQANADGIYAHPEDPRFDAVEDGFRGWGRIISDFDTGEWAFETIKPGACAGRNGAMQAPHISFWIVARGINLGLTTRMYFSDVDNSKDPVINMVEHDVRRDTLIAKRSIENGTVVYHFDIVLQGENETVFFDI